MGGATIHGVGGTGLVASICLGLLAVGSSEPPTYPRVRHGRPPPPRIQRHASPHVPHRRGPSDLDLVRREDGSYDYEDPGGRFRARIKRDGTVQFADPMRRMDTRDAQNGTCCTAEVLTLLIPGTPLPGPVEWILHAQGQDLAAKAKADFLERTRAFRTTMAIGHALERIEEAKRNLPRQLLAIWTDETVPLQRRKNLLFARWDECAESFGATPGDAEIPPEATRVVERAREAAAAWARRAIEAFVRRHAPPHSATAFHPAELDALNRARTSVEAFRPYR